MQIISQLHQAIRTAETYLHALTEFIKDMTNMAEQENNQEVKATAEQHKKALEKQLWNIANALRGNMSADEFRDYILGFIFYKYLSERMHQYADGILAEDGLKFNC